MMIIVVNIHNYILTRCYVSCYVNVQDPLDGGSLQIMPSLPKLMNRITWYENVEYFFFYDYFIFFLMT